MLTKLLYEVKSLLYNPAEWTYSRRDPHTALPEVNKDAQTRSEGSAAGTLKRKR